MILFICTGNTCRSVMAEALMRRLWQQYGDDRELIISSAGLSPVEKKSSLHVRELLAREKISVESHIPCRITKSQVGEARLILVMEEYHRQRVLDLYPNAADKIYLLKEFAGITGENMDIEDPYGGSRATYSRILEEIREAVKQVVAKLMDQNKFVSGEEISRK